MRSNALSLIGIVIALGVARSVESQAERVGVEATAVPNEIREQLLEARDRAWRAFFAADPEAALEKILGPELIAIQESSDRWESRGRLIAMAKSMKEQNVRLLRLEFPRTEIQLFDDTAVLFYTYIFATGNDRGSGTHAGRGTEIFVRRNGSWVDVGWHLDNGPFVQQDGKWIRVGGPEID